MDKIKAIIFDVGGVLQLGDNSSLRHKKITRKGVHGGIAKELGVSLDQYLDSIDTAYAKSVEGKISGERVIKIMARNLRTTPSRLKKLYKAAYKRNFHLNKELLHYAKILRKIGYKISILSDQWEISKRALITKNFYQVFRPVIVSCDVGLRKPDQRIYRLMLKRLKIKPEKSVFIDNQEWNLTPARKIGMKIILFKNNKQTIRELNRILK